MTIWSARRHVPGAVPGRAPAGYSQAVDHGASFPTLPLPLVHLGEQAEEGLLGVGNVAVRRPAEELELAHHQLALLELNAEKEGKGGENSQPQRR